MSVPFGTRKKKIMGTNYYVRVPVLKCPHCGHDTPEGFEDFHIGKDSSGWEFSFQGYKNHPTMPEISSINDWITFLDAKKIVDEHNQEITVPEFIDLVKKSRGAWSVGREIKRPQNHFNYCLVHHSDMMGGMWLDADGWSFNAQDFF